MESRHCIRDISENCQLQASTGFAPQPVVLALPCVSLVSDSLVCIFVIGEAALAANLITGLIFKHLEQNLATQTAPKVHFQREITSCYFLLETFWEPACQISFEMLEDQLHDQFGDSPMTQMQGSPQTTAWHGRLAGRGSPVFWSSGRLH